jgi:hypothetical protein
LTIDALFDPKNRLDYMDVFNVDEILKLIGRSLINYASYMDTPCSLADFKKYMRPIIAGSEDDHIVAEFIQKIAEPVDNTDLLDKKPAAINPVTDANNSPSPGNTLC